MISMQSSIRNVRLINNTLVDVSLVDVSSFESNELQDEIPDEFQDEFPDEFYETFPSEISNESILFLINYRNRTYYYYIEESSPKNVINLEKFDSLEKCTEIITCFICLEESEDNIKLPCNHIFCNKCIKKWLLSKSNTCPTCRKIVE